MGGGGASKLPLSIPRFSNSHFFPNSASTGTTTVAGSVSSGGPLVSGPLGRGSKTRSLSTADHGSEGLEVPATANPDYIMQLVSDVRKFADVFLHLKEVFSSEGKGQQQISCCGFTLPPPRPSTCFVLFWP